MDSKLCAQCGKSFRSPWRNKNQKYCSAACYNASRPRAILTCGQCGKTFEAGGRTYVSRGARFCSVQCSSAARYANYERPAYVRPPDDLKPCPKCRELLPLHRFTKDKTRLDGLSAYCRDCIKALKAKDHRQLVSTESGRKRKRRNGWVALLRTYGMTEAGYEALYASQEGVCAICKQPQRLRNTDGLRPLCVDHDHLTGTVRGLLCHSCNVALGHFREDPARLVAAMAYLSRG